MTVANFLPEQYTQDKKLRINHNYLSQQFSDADIILEKIKNVVMSNDFTLGKPVDDFENRFKNSIHSKHAIGVGSGTDALFLSLKALGVQPGDEVITTPFTFYATIGAIVTAGARPVFADILSDYNLDPNQIESKITKNTKAIISVHWAGKPCRMDDINFIAKKNNLFVIEDACHAIQATYKNRYAGTLGDIGCFSFHPLKNLNVWGDGGIITTQSDEIADRLRLMRNHGLKGRDECVQFSYNSRLDTIQAVVADHLFSKLDVITRARIYNANYLDVALQTISEITIPKREREFKQVYHLYSIVCENRNVLKQHLIENGVDAKIHYPVPMHLQSAADYLGYRPGDFPVAEKISKKTLSLPVHEFISENDLNDMIELILEFY
ncbi:MAG: pyridoxal-5'-phosphate-dependent protein [Gammaproteobacteria bacterium RIFCSPLOWO2_02_FULL_42_14]|nr:MAG: pyridoxal-5'-phosphate-dependent protein [Gammaproteobacteria bacterium RIFCSPHIGHO2_02_FULL_42_43]OGT28550.1 MAG: pyridoxal-5'-phosphate-dependent protein [Gammaproteobacteria bacterium RIFCSPHIGHO2_01_FULL_42_8]OGT51393.1 MAG: pyridoxal-5'-phosphate-dependent protein [Gammaproteobacteria bacterium RIFCSPHIGHO2_12_FULL_41_25]OGT62095.1 MAG: pyridoxal-5'-phosphate-dependent protein [Gammaproteobacteria bacterium RIFCSPLOWO2_02_FULL_42_14]OGT85767.1 MAG: pyridoxal-5'-phosphate-dependent 